MDDPLAAHVAQLLLARKWTIAVAESCTGGFIAHRLTNMPGSSGYFKGCLVAYAYDAKENVLHVPVATLMQYGSVSREVVLVMAHHVRQLFASDLGLAVTGITGPGGGTPTKPVGLTYIGLVAAGYELTEKFIWQGDRLSNKQSSADAALNMIVRYLIQGAEMDDQREPSIVTADYPSDQTLRPRTFTWQGKLLTVVSIGRQWIENQQRYVLVMTDAHQTFELAVDGGMQWTVKAVSGGVRPT